MTRQQMVKPGEPRLPAPANLATLGLTAAEWKIVTDVIFPGAQSRETVVLAVQYCQARTLDIMKRPVHIVPMWSKEQRAMVETIWPSVNEIQITASRTGQWAGMDPPKFGARMSRTFRGRRQLDGEWVDEEVEVTFPESAEVTVYRMVGGHRCPFTEPVRWDESYARMGRTELPNEMWRKRPTGQLVKCAKAASLRAAFPEEAGYAAEEMEGKPLEAVSSSVIDGEVLAERKGFDPETGEVHVPEELDESRVTDRHKAFIARLVERASATGAFAAAESTALERLSGDALAYALQHIRKAREVAGRPATGEGDRQVA